MRPDNVDAVSAPLIEAFHAGHGGIDTLVTLGTGCLVRGDALTAASFGRAAQFLAPEHAAPRLLLGSALVELGEYSQAVDVLHELWHEVPNEVSSAASHRAPDTKASNGTASGEVLPIALASSLRAEFAERAATDILSECASRIALGRALSGSSRSAEAIPEFQRAVAAAPDSAAALTWLGEALAHAKRYPEAFTSLNRAIALDPLHGRAHTALGEALIEVGRPVAAFVPLKQALALDTGRGAPAVAFAQALVRLGKLGDALPWFNRAIEIEPTCAEAFRHLGRTLAALRLDNEALSCIRAARQLRGGDWPDTWMDEAGLLLRRGDFRAGWRAYENREFAQRLATITPSVWNGDDSIAGESLLLIAEQGLGDTIQFVRFARHVAALGAQVTVEVQPPLKGLLARSVADTDRVQVIARGEAQPVFTRQNSLVSMPHALRIDGEGYGNDVPYLSARDDLVPFWRARLDTHWVGAHTGPRLRVGLVTSGNPLFRSDADRSMPLAQAAPLLARTDIQWVIVQPELRARDQATLDAHPATWLCGKELRDFDDTAALLASLDLVISVDSSVAHLAGAMGRPVWLLLPFFGDWRWLQDRADSPWYPSATLFRQAAPQDWQSVIAAVADSLDHACHPQNGAKPS